jgi:type 1 glutamine amidotransferase
MIPRSFLIDKSGKVIYSSIGFTPEEFNKLMKQIEKALK